MSRKKENLLPKFWEYPKNFPFSFIFNYQEMCQMKKPLKCLYFRNKMSPIWRQFLFFVHKERLAKTSAKSAYFELIKEVTSKAKNTY